MNIKKSTEYNYDESILKDFLKNIDSKSALDVYYAVNKSYGLDSNMKIKLSEYANELARRSIEYQKKDNILYAVFDVCLGFHTLSLINKTTKNNNHKKDVVELINKSMKILYESIE